MIILRFRIVCLIAMDATFTLTGYTASDVDGTAQAAAPMKELRSRLVRSAGPTSRGDGGQFLTKMYHAHSDFVFLRHAPVRAQLPDGRIDPAGDISAHRYVVADRGGRRRFVRPLLMRSGN
jgi:hypothetical protein